MYIMLNYIMLFISIHNLPDHTRSLCTLFWLADTLSSTNFIAALFHHLVFIPGFHYLQGLSCQHPLLSGT